MIKGLKTKILIALTLLLLLPFAAPAQEEAELDPGVDEVLDEGLFEDALEDEEQIQNEYEDDAPPIPPLPPIAPPRDNRFEMAEPGEGESRWNITITAAVVMTYVFNDSPDSFTIRYRFEIKGQANADIAVMNGELDIAADVQGPLAKWPTGECQLFVNVPKVPYELTFRKTGDDRSSLRLVLKRAVNESWQSKCTFTDDPDSKLETTGAPETWLARALEKARPPIRDLIADLGDEETTTRFVIGKESISDPPLGSGEIEGTGVITIRPGGPQ
ncbi:MAG TPA: hypothetical protein PLZ86_01535 [bacterium]|nr:hypothetical protein [bacterium]